MSSRKASAQVSASGVTTESPSWVKVCVIAGLGFAVGIAWPRLTGFRLAPRAPNTSSTETTNAVAAPAVARQEEPGRTEAPASQPAVNPPPPPQAAPAQAPAGGGALAHVTIDRARVLSCKSPRGDKLKGVRSCGSVPALDSAIQAKLNDLRNCPAARSATGRLSALVTVDFTQNRIEIQPGKSSTVNRAGELVECLRGSLRGVTLKGLEHVVPEYLMYYGMDVAPVIGAPGEQTAAPSNQPAQTVAPDPTPVVPPPAEPSGKMDDAPKAPASPGTVSTIEWDVALVRDAPRVGQLVARLSHGSQVRVETQDNGWYRVRFGEGFTESGWVYRGAIGR